MKTTNQQTKQTRGSALVITISVVSVAMLVLAAYLMSVQAQVASVSRSQTWNQSISLAEAGMDEAMSMINYGSPSIIVNPYAWTNMLTTAYWTIDASGTNATITRYVSGSNKYTATISWNSTNAPTLSSAGIVSYTPIPWVFSAARSHSFLAAGGTSSGGSTNNGSTTNSGTVVTNVTMGRKIQVSTVLSPLFSAGIVCKTNFDMSGNNCTVDSFDSSSSTYSTAGQWDVTKRKANGNVATDSTVTSGAFKVGNGNIFGSVYTGPGTAETCVSIGPNGTVGDLAWASNKTGIETNHWFGNFNMYIPDVSAPNTTGWSTSLPAASNNLIVLNGGNYVVSSLPSTALLVSNTTATVWVQSAGAVALGVSFTNNGQLILYVGNTTGSSTSLGLSGNGTMNYPGYASNLQIYGLPSLTSVDFHGNATWVGALYAPEASFIGGGGGNNTQDTSGAIVVNGVSLKGHWNFHYDEHLAISGPSRGWVATGWKEVPFTTN